jgi:DNA-binding NtrC family response regulator
MHTEGGFEHADADAMTGERESQERGAIRFVGRSSAILAVLDDLQSVSTTRAPVLLEGESGTGKELVARLIHEEGSRGRAPFEAVNCGAIPETLLESELFGHVPGAFTGASRAHRGVFERAREGTVFLDEIAELSLSAQVKLLRVLQEGTFTPVGGEGTRRSGARVVAATNRDLRVEVRKGRFREDLYYRLNVFPIRIPPLRERREDIPPLIEHFLDRHAREWNRPRPSVRPDALRRLMVYSYPGNVRELQNIVSALLIEARGGSEIRDRHVVAVFSRHRLAEPARDDDLPAAKEAGGNAEAPAADVGQWVLVQLRRYHFNVALAERMLTTRQREVDDPRRIPVCSRSGLTYYFQGEGFRALAQERWNLDAAAVRIAAERALEPRVRAKLERFLATAIGAMRGDSLTSGQRFLGLRKAFGKMPQTYQEDLLKLAEAFERGRWS